MSYPIVVWLVGAAGLVMSVECVGFSISLRHDIAELLSGGWSDKLSALCLILVVPVLALAAFLLFYVAYRLSAGNLF